jgi:hypothetical protein
MATSSGVSTDATGVESEAEPVPESLRRLFLVHALVQGGTGLSLLLLPETWAALAEWGPTFDPLMGRVAGTLFLGLAAGQAVALRAERWDQILPLFAAVLTETLLGLVAFLYAGLSGASPGAASLVFVYAVFAVGFGYYARDPLGVGRE